MEKVWLVADARHKYCDACYIFGIFTTLEKAKAVCDEYGLPYGNNILDIELDEVCKTYENLKTH